MPADPRISSLGRLDPHPLLGIHFLLCLSLLATTFSDSGLLCLILLCLILLSIALFSDSGLLSSRLKGSQQPMIPALLLCFESSILPLSKCDNNKFWGFSVVPIFLLSSEALLSLLSVVMDLLLQTLNSTELAIYCYPDNSGFHHSNLACGVSRINRPTRRVASRGLPDINSTGSGLEYIKSIISKLEAICLIGSALVDVSLRLHVTLILFRNLSIFPGTIRPRCTTMPWTIWPSLAVLSGVCWMFYPPHAADGTYHLETETSQGEYKFCSLHAQRRRFQQNLKAKQS